MTNPSSRPKDLTASCVTLGATYQELPRKAYGPQAIWWREVLRRPFGPRDAQVAAGGPLRWQVLPRLYRGPTHAGISQVGCKVLDLARVLGFQSFELWSAP